MAETRCPMCGKPNSEDLEVCEFCQARLKPLISPSPGDESTRELFTGSGQADPRESEIEAEPEESIPDWLQSLRQEKGEGEFTAPAGEEEDFMGLLGVEGDEAPSGEEEEQPGWMPPVETDKSKITPADAEANYRDWLESLRAGDETSKPPEMRPEDASGGWLRSDRIEDEKPTWLSDLRSTSEEAAFESPLAETTPLSQPEDPEWLQQLRERRMGEEILPPPDEEGEDIHPESLAESGTAQLPDIPGLPENEIDLPEEEIPDWLTGMVDSPSEDNPEDLPDWLVSGTPPPEEGLPPPFEELAEEGASTQLDPEAKIPDWLSGIMGSQPEPPPSELPLEEDIPDWLTGKEKAAEQRIEPAEATEGQGEGADFEWIEEPGLSGEEKVPADKPRVVAPFTLDEETAGLEMEGLPDWLKEASAQEAPPEGAAMSEEDAALIPAALPAWLEAMRPVEAAAPGVPLIDESERSVENSGPLAGLRGILRAEPDVARQKKPPAYTIKLQVSESHQSHAAILEKLINAEGVVTPVSTRKIVSRQTLWRIIIFALLVVAAAWPIYSGSQGVVLPQLPDETFAARAIIDSLTVDSATNQGAVLLAVDYEPGFAGEMDAASAALVDHLMIKGAPLALVSTTPSGPAQAERLLSKVNRSSGQLYTRGAQYVNLGFIPGGASGLLAFAQNPQRVLPYTLDAAPAWAEGPLKGIANLADFSLVVVLTENPDTARAWIEQVQPVLSGKPLLMVISAQAEPLVRPYYEGTPQQVQGMLVGLAGGAAYESSMPRAIQARQYWDAYSFTMTVAILIIFIAGVANVLPSLATRRKPVKGEM